MKGRLPALIAVVMALAQCSKPTSPPGPLPGAAEYQALGAWLAGQGIPAPAGGPPAGEAAGKAASGHRLLGDATGDGAVTFWDLWPLWQYLTGHTYMVEHYDFDLLDIDRDGDNDWDDLKHLGRFLYAAESGNPWKIGEPLAPPLLAALSPSPSELDLVADGTLWHRLDLSVTTPDGAASAAEVRVRVNPADTGPPVLEIARRTTAPAADWCGGEPDDTKTGVDGRVFWLAGCQAGDGAVEILDGDDNLLASYPVTVREPPSDNPSDSSDSDSFNIELVFDRGVFTEHHKALIRQAADRWEEVITGDLPDVDVRGGDVVDDLRISVGIMHGNVFAGRAEVIGERPNGSPYLAGVLFNESSLVYVTPESSSVYTNIYSDPLVILALHEIAHCLGIGIGETWQGFRSGRSFTGPLAIQAFDAAGGDSYAGDDKVPTERDGAHWRASVFTRFPAIGEVMSSHWWGYHLSAITIAALADMGYEVDFSRADPYTLPGDRSVEEILADLAAGKAAGRPPLVCGVGRPGGPSGG